MIAGVASRPTMPARPASAVRAGGTTAPAATPAQPPAVVAPQQAIAPMSFDVAGLFDGIKKFFTGILNFFKNLFKPKDTGALDPDTQAVATAYNLLPTKENVQAFLAEARSYEQNGTLGPGSPNAQAVTEIQTALKNWGYNVTVNGTYDAATGDAVKAFKRANGIHQSYQMADGSWGVNEYFDNATLAKFRELLSSGQQPPVTPPTENPPGTGTPTQPGTIDYAAIATQYKLEASEANVKAFLAEVQGYAANGTLGPDYPNAEDIRELQGVLQAWGYALTPTGSWDAATSQAIIKFKLDNGLHQTYKSADGNWAVNEYAEPQTLAKIREKLGV